jgi:hypothetical protein
MQSLVAQDVEVRGSVEIYLEAIHSGKLTYASCKAPLCHSAIWPKKDETNLNL